MIENKLTDDELDEIEGFVFRESTHPAAIRAYNDARRQGKDQLEALRMALREMEARRAKPDVGDAGAVSSTSTRNPKKE